MRRYTLVKNKKYQILVSMLLVMAVVLTLSLLVLYQARTFRQFSGIQVDPDKAYSLARSGISIAESFIAHWRPCAGGSLSMDETYNFGSGTIRIQIDQDNLTIASTGTVGKSVRQITKAFSLPDCESAK